MLKVLFNFIKAFHKMHFIGPCLIIFGSARFNPKTAHYKNAERIGAEIAKLGFTLVTGQGLDITAAANKCAHETGGYSVGSNVVLPVEQKPNSYLHKYI